MPRIEHILAHDFKMEENWLCLTKNGWLPEQEEVSVQLGRGLTLESAMDMIWEQNKGLLGAGELVFSKTGESGAMPSGFITFRPGQAC